MVKQNKQQVNPNTQNLKFTMYCDYCGEPHNVDILFIGKDKTLVPTHYLVKRIPGLVGREFYIFCSNRCKQKFAGC